MVSGLTIGHSTVHTGFNEDRLRRYFDGIAEVGRETIYFLDNTAHLVEHIEEPPIWQIEVLVATLDHGDHPVSVAAVTLLDCRSRVARDSMLRQCYEAFCEPGKTR